MALVKKSKVLQADARTSSSSCNLHNISKMKKKSRISVVSFKRFQKIGKFCL